MISYLMSSSFLVLAILIIRKIIWEKCNPNIIYLLWLFLAIRIMFIAQFPVEIKVNNEHILKNTSNYTEVSNQHNEINEDAPYYSEVKNNTDKSLKSKTRKTVNYKKVVTAIWIIGSLALSIYFVVVNVCIYKSIEKRKIGKIGKIAIFETDGYNCLIGIINPKILIDKEIRKDANCRKNIILHELQHYKAKDNLWLLVAGICLVIQWINPLVWIAYSKMREDCEIACDYRVTKRLDMDGKESYIQTIIRILKNKKKRMVTVTYAGSVNMIKKRMKSIFRKGKENNYLTIVFALAIVTLIASIKIITVAENQNDYLKEDYSKSIVDNNEESSMLSMGNKVYVDSREILDKGNISSYADCYTREIYRGGNHFWIDNDNVLWGTGMSENGQLGVISAIGYMNQEPIKIAENVMHVDFSGEYFVIFLNYEGELYGLGGNPAGVLSKATKDDKNNQFTNAITESVLIMDKVVFAKCGYSSIIALLKNGEVYVMGNNSFSPVTNETYVETQKVMDNARYVTSYFNTYAVIRDDDSLWTWGDNRLGQCGLGVDTKYISNPQKVTDNVECVWMGKVAFNSKSTACENNNMVVKTKDGVFYACGEGVGNNITYDETDDFINVENKTPQIITSNILCNVNLEENAQIENVDLGWSEKQLLDFLEKNNIDFYTANEENTNYLVYIANHNTWEFTINEDNIVAVISSTESDRFVKNELKEGDPFNKIIDKYGQYDNKVNGEYDFYKVCYSYDDYDFWIAFYDNLGCAKFSKCLKGFVD